MAYGLDIGPGAIRAVTDAGDGPTVESVPPVVVPVDDGFDAATLPEPGATIDGNDATYAVGAAARAGTLSRTDRCRVQLVADRVDVSHFAPTLLTGAEERVPDRLPSVTPDADVLALLLECHEKPYTAECVNSFHGSQPSSPIAV